MMLLIDDAVRARIDEVIAYAEAHVVTMDDMLDTLNGVRPPVGDSPEYVVEIPVGFRAVYSLEEQVQGRMRHLSMSAAKVGSLPPIQAVREILKLFGFTHPLENCQVRLEELGRGQAAINVWEEVRP